MPDFVTRSALGFGGPVELHAARDGRHRPVWESTQSAAVFDTNKWFSGDLDWSFLGTKPLWGEVMLARVRPRLRPRPLRTAPTRSCTGRPGTASTPTATSAGGTPPVTWRGWPSDGLGQGCFRSGSTGSGDRRAGSHPGSPAAAVARASRGCGAAARRARAWRCRRSRRRRGRSLPRASWVLRTPRCSCPPPAWPPRDISASASSSRRG